MDNLRDTPILDHSINEASVFLPDNLLSRSATMLGKKRGNIPLCCVLDFDGELLPVAKRFYKAILCESWSCFHTNLFTISSRGIEMGLIGGTVGAPFAVLIAEQLIASGCRHIIGYSSAGAIADNLSLPCLVVPNRGLRDEGVSYHYLPPSKWVDVNVQLPRILLQHALSIGLPLHSGPTWTTDAPYRETQSQIEQHRRDGILTVEMEAAALMALSNVCNVEIASLLHVTNTLATSGHDFHKGPEDIHQRILHCCLTTFAEVLKVKEKEVV